MITEEVTKAVAIGCAIAALGAAALAGVQTYRLADAREQLAGYATAAAKESEAARAEEKRTQTIANREGEDATKQHNQARADAADAHAAGQRLRINSVRGHATAGNSGASAECAAAVKVRDVCNDVLGRLVGVAEDLARFGDEATIAGRACERIYDGLTHDRAADQ